MSLDLCAPWAEPDQLRPDGDCTPCAGVTDVAPPDEVLEDAILVASQWLHAASGFKYPGVCTREGDEAARPCAGDPTCGGVPWVPPGDHPDYQSPRAIGLGVCGVCGTGDCCGPVGVTLGYRPVVTVDEVRVDGDVVDPADYTLVGDILVRTDGQAWPHCQDLSQPDTETGTFAVDFTWGVAPPQSGVQAAIDLGCVLAKAACGDASCLPVGRVVRTQTAGRTVEVASPTKELLEEMPRTVRMFLNAVNPGGYRSGPKLRRPKVPARSGTCLGC